MGFQLVSPWRTSRIRVLEDSVLFNMAYSGYKCVTRKTVPVTVSHPYDGEALVTMTLIDESFLLFVYLRHEGGQVCVFVHIVTR
jgi:hypothetical protein